jgi:hypothetical protein
VGTYNQTKKGHACPAKLKSLHDDRLLIITSPRGQAEDHYHLITVEIRASVREEEFLIEATKSEWAAPPVEGALPTESIDTSEYIFQLDADLATGDTWLAYKDQKFGAFKCAEFLLFEALT